jgi:flagellar biosynthesis/type III secretory pathway protein FliH
VEIQQARLRTLEGEALRRNVSELALAVTRQVLGEAWEAEPSTWARAVFTAAEPLRRAAALSLRVSPASATAVRDALAVEIAAGSVGVVEDAAVDEAGCIAVSSCGRVDGRLSTMLASFRGPLGIEEPG